MLIHIALFKWKKGCSAQDVDGVMADIYRLQEQIPEVIELRAGANFGRFNEGFTHAVVVKLKDRDDLALYRAHPAHVKVAERVDEMFEHSVGIDFEC